MDTFNKVIKTLGKKYDENRINSRRLAEDYPMVEAKADDIIFDAPSPFKMDFYVSKHPHSVYLNLYVRPPVNCFQCKVGPAVDFTEATATGGTQSGPEDGNQYPVTYTGFSANVGGFILASAGGIIVPRTGYYNFNFVMGSDGVVVSGAASAVASVRLGESIIVQKAWTTTNGGLTGGFVGVSVNLNGLCLLAEQGTVISGWIGAGGIAFWNPTGYATITLAALA